MKKQIELVSIIIPTYKRYNNLRRAILSVQKQSHPNIEIIVVDDNNPDSEYRKNVEKLITDIQLNESRLKYIKHEFNKNGSAARNTGLYNSKGDYIAFLDDDDEFVYNKIEKQLDLLRDQADYCGSYCLIKQFKSNRLFYKSTYNHSGDCSLDILLLNAEIWTSTLIIKKESILKINGFDESFERHQDYEFLLRLFDVGKIVCLEDYLVKVHIDSSINRPCLKSLESTKQKLLDKFKIKIQGFPEKTQKEIRKAHNLEIFGISLYRVNIRYFFKYLMKLDLKFKDVRKVIMKILKHIKKIF